MSIAQTGELRIALICNVGFAAGWHPLGIAMLKENLERCTNVLVDNHYFSSEFTWYINRHYPRLAQIDADIAEEGASYHEIYYSTKLFNHSRPATLIETVLLDEYNHRDIYRRRLGDKEASGELPPSWLYSRNCIMKYCELLDRFISDKLQGIEWGRYALVGFSCLSAQLLCSVYTAWQLRARGFKGLIVFGGGMFRKWNVHQYGELFPHVNEFVVGDGYPALLRILKSNARPLRVSCEATQHHYGDFSDMAGPLLRSRAFSVPVQLSSTCSWGKCVFCSIQRGPRRKVLPWKVSKWIAETNENLGVWRFGFVDSDLNGDMHALFRVCSALAEKDKRLSLYGMFNTFNLTREGCRLLALAGFRTVFLGVENLSNAVLSNMGKRSTVLDNVKALKWLVEADIEKIVFNILIDFIGTDRLSIEENLHVLDAISHLLTRNVECDLIEFTLERDSAAYTRRAQLKLRGIKNYKFDEICYPPRIRRSLRFHSMKYRWTNMSRRWEAVAAHLQKRHAGRLNLLKRQRSFLVCGDRLPGGKRTLAKPEGEIYIHICNKTSTLDELSRKFATPKDELRAMLERFTSLGLAIRDNERYLGLALAK